MVSRKKSRKASRKRRSSKPKKIGYYVKNGKVLIAYEGHNRQGKLVHKDSAGKTIRKTVKIHKLKRDANKHAKSKKGRKASRKSSRKRKSAKRKASRKRKSAKRKSRKRKSAKRKASCKRKSAKRKASRKRKSAKRKSRKRKSAKRKASRKRKSKFRSSKKSCGFSAGKKKRKYRQKKKKKRRRKKAWSSKAPMTRSSRMKLYRRDPSCFLLPPMHGEMPKYPICDKKGKKLCEGVLSAKMRADLVKNTFGEYGNKRSRKSAKRVSKKASKIARDHGCRKMASLYRRHH